MKNTKRCFCGNVIVFLAFMALCSTFAFAYSGGSGTPDNPYQIADACDLLELAADTTNYDKSFILTSDIDLAGQNFTAAVIAPDAGIGIPFTGDFNGAGHVISNLTINYDNKSYLGLFGGIQDGNVANLIIENVTITGDTSASNIGGLAGFCSYSSISNCVSSVNIQGSNYSNNIGGLIGKCSDSDIENCSASGEITGVEGTYYAGGLAGFCQASLIINCNATSNIDVNSPGAIVTDLGGLIGKCISGSSVNNCFSYGNVTSTGNSYYIGGLIGNSQNGISQCFAAGNVAVSGEDSQYVGGLVGQIDADIINCSAGGNVSASNGLSNFIGGLAGQSQGDTINCYATGNVSGLFDGCQYLGGLIGNATKGTVSNCNSAGNVSAGAGAFYIGGLIGSTRGNINNCYSTAIVSCGDSSSNAGGLAGIAYINCDINNCYASGNVACGESCQAVGGMVGYNYGQISDCIANGNITGEDFSNYLGGLTGRSDGNINRCSASGSVTGGDSSTSLGGLTGDSTEYISECFSAGSVTGGNYINNFGGFAGSNYGQINRCFSTGSITGGIYSYIIGGFTGAAGGNIIDCYSLGNITLGDSSDIIGGFIGYNGYNNLIRNCYSAGIIAASFSSNIGGFAGQNDNGPISNCYFLVTSGPDNDFGFPLSKGAMKKQASFAGFDFVGAVNGANDVWTIYPGVTYPKFTWNFSLLAIKCKVAAGSKPNTDSISMSGLVLATAKDFNDANVSDSNFVELSVASPDATIVFRFPVDGKTWKKGKYSFSGTENGVKKSFKFDSKTSTFSLAASKMSLKGLSAPMNVQIKVGGYTGKGTLDETIVNGSKKPIPMKLLMGVKNAMRIDKYKITTSTKLNADSLTFSGAFAVPEPNDANLVELPLTITLDNTQSWTIPDQMFKAKKGVYSCSKASANGPGLPLAYGSFNFNKCVFTLTIKQAEIQKVTGLVNLGVEFSDFDQTQQIKVK